MLNSEEKLKNEKTQLQAEAAELRDHLVQRLNECTVFAHGESSMVH